MFGISGFELLIVMMFVLIIFGPDKLPELGRMIGRTISMFKRAQEDMERVIRAEVYAAEGKPMTAADAAAQAGSASAPGMTGAEPATTAATIWATADEDDEEEDEE